MKFFLSRDERNRRREQRRAVQERTTDLIVTTADIKGPYTILGILQADSLILLKERAVQAGADAIVGLGFAGYDMQCYGTAVVLDKKQEALDLDHVVSEMVNCPKQSGVPFAESQPALHQQRPDTEEIDEETHATGPSTVSPAKE